MIYKKYSKRQKRWVWAINFTVSGKRIRQSGFATQEEAKEAIASVRMRHRSWRLGLEVPESEITLGQLLEARRKDKSAADSTMRARMLGWFADFVASVGPAMAVRSVKLTHLHRFRDASTGGPAALNNKVAGVIAALNASQRYFPELEDYRAPKMTMAKTAGRSVLVPRKEFQALLTALRTSPRNRYPEIASIIEMLGLTGARVGEILSLKPAQVDWERELLTIYATKTRTTKPLRVIPLTPRMTAILRNWNKPTLTYPSLYKIFRTIRNHTIPGSSWHLHDIRHTAASLMAEAGISHAIIADMLGHVLSGMTQRYTHATIPGLRVAALVLEHWCTDAAGSNLRVV